MDGFRLDGIYQILTQLTIAVNNLVDLLQHHNNGVHDIREYIRDFDETLHTIAPQILNKFHQLDDQIKQLDQNQQNLSQTTQETFKSIQEQLAKLSSQIANLTKKTLTEVSITEKDLIDFLIQDDGLYSTPMGPQATTPTSTTPPSSSTHPTSSSTSSEPSK